jgi:hypothetical protein
MLIAIALLFTCQALPYGRRSESHRTLGLPRDSTKISRRPEDPELELDALDDTPPEDSDTKPSPLETKTRLRRPASTDTPPKHHTAPNKDLEETPKENAPENNVYASVKFRPANEQYSHEEAKKLLTSKIGAILWRDSVRVNMRSVVIQELFELRKDLTRLYPNNKKPLPEIHINSGTDGRHARGKYSHGTGYKVDLDLRCKKFRNYIYKHMKKIDTRSDGAAQYVPKGKREFASKVVYALEYTHVDILVVP